MSGDLAWQVDPDRTPSQATLLQQAQYYQWYMTHMPMGAAAAGGLTGGLWSCLGSSDAVTAGLDGVDRWGAAFDATKIVRAAAGIAHSWFVIQSPASFGAGTGPYYMIVDFSTGVDSLTTLVFSKNAPTGGTTLNRPTATDEIVSVGRQVSQNPLVASRVHGWLADAGDFMVAHNPAAAAAIFPFALMVLSTYQPAVSTDAYRAVFLNDFNTTGSGALERAQIVQGAVTTDRAQSRNFDDTVTLGLTGIIPAVTIAPAGSVALMVAGNFGGAVDAASGLWGTWPVWFYSPTAANKTIKGRIPSVLWCPDSVPMAAVGPVSGPGYDYMRLANFWVPWPASAQPTGFALNEVDRTEVGTCVCDV